MFELKHARHKFKTVYFFWKKKDLTVFLRITGVQNQLPIRFGATLIRIKVLKVKTLTPHIRISNI